jgi:hypothetical protein
LFRFLFVVIGAVDWSKLWQQRNSGAPQSICSLYLSRTL